MIADSTWHDSAEVRQVGRDVDREAVERDPTFHPHADRGDLGFVGAVADPQADAAGFAPRGDTEAGERRDQPALERMDEMADVAPARIEVLWSANGSHANPTRGSQFASDGFAAVV